jgi:hypothetical protein
MTSYRLATEAGVGELARTSATLLFVVYNSGSQTRPAMPHWIL